EIRTGTFEAGQVELREGQDFTLTTRDVPGTEAICSISYKGLPQDVEVGDRILIDDGLIGLRVKEIRDAEIFCTVENPGTVKNYKGVNVPGVKINLPAVTERDRSDILFGVENGIDFIAASFVRKASDVEEIRAVLREVGREDIPIISKIENKEGVDNIAEILEVSQGIMVARGDLGVEIPPEEVPIIQKKIIRRCNFKGIPVITATQMLDSMIRNPRPTRAEVADVANAILDGTDAIMLSGETASGKYPEEAVATMVRIAQTAEAELNYEEILREKSSMRDQDITNAIGHATCTSAASLKARAILTPTTGGRTAFAVAKFRPRAPIYAFPHDARIARRLALCWGTTPLLLGWTDHERQLFQDAVAQAKGKGLLEDGDIVVITAGSPVGTSGRTNMMRIHEVGQPL
ncbi:MAG: pyruvate kinase, partial [Firmicutes bacterium]|nr:pyruvate kinase [Bacillota bacterium]